MTRAPRWIVRPAVIIPLVLTIGVLAAFFSLADIGKVAATIAGFRLPYLLAFVLLMVLYQGLRAAQWHLFLRRLGVRLSLRSQMLAYAMGEAAKLLPVGNYFQNYVLKSSGGPRFGRSAAATTLIIWEEVAICLIALEILGLGSWTGWIRIAIPVGLLIVTVLAWAFIRVTARSDRPAWIQHNRLLHRLASEYDTFAQGAGDLLTPRTVAATLTYSALYLVVAGLGLYVLALALGITGVSVRDVLAVYFFSLAVGLIIPLPVDLGAIELGGLGAFVAIGVGRDLGLSAMIVNRVLSIGASLLIAGLVLVLLRREVALAMRGPEPAVADTAAAAIESECGSCAGEGDGIPLEAAALDVDDWTAEAPTVRARS